MILMARMARDPYPAYCDDNRLLSSGLCNPFEVEHIAAEMDNIVQGLQWGSDDIYWSCFPINMFQ